MKNWNDVTKEDLEELFYNKHMIKRQVAEMLDVTMHQLEYKMKKCNINIQRHMMNSAIKHAFSKYKQAQIEQIIYSEDIVYDGDLDFGPVKITGGKFKGRIGCYDDND